MAAYFPDGGFMADGDDGPMREKPLDWYVWHFTPIDNLDGIIAAGGLLPDTAAPAALEIASKSIKGRRKTIQVHAAEYPNGYVVGDHIPWYFAARSPTLYRVVNGYDLDYKGGHAPLVMFGLRLGDLTASGATWCYSDRNAADSLVRFGTDVSLLADAIDFDLMGNVAGTTPTMIRTAPPAERRKCSSSAAPT